MQSQKIVKIRGQLCILTIFTGQSICLEVKISLTTKRAAIPLP